MHLKQQIIDKIKFSKPRDYEISEKEFEIIDMMVDVISGLKDDQKYIQDEYKRVLNEKLNLQEIVYELEEQLKELKCDIFLCKRTYYNPPDLGLGVVKTKQYLIFQEGYYYGFYEQGFFYNTQFSERVVRERISLTTIKNTIGIDYMWDYFYTKEELRKLKINKILKL